MLRHDDGALEKLLQSAGYSVQNFIHVSLQSSGGRRPQHSGAQSGQNVSNQSNANGGGQQQQAVTTLRWSALGQASRSEGQDMDRFKIWMAVALSIFSAVPSGSRQRPIFASGK